LSNSADIVAVVFRLKTGSNDIKTQMTSTSSMSEIPGESV